jgi:pimeloyl-ACP methyl ester carboxylesterase
LEVKREGGDESAYLSVANSPADPSKRQRIIAFADKCFAGVALFAPALQPLARPGWAVRSLLRLVTVIGGGWLALGPAPTPAQFLNQEAYDRFIADKYCYSGAVRLSLGGGVLALGDAARELIPSITFPFILFHGRRDLSVTLSGSEYFVQNSATLPANKKLVIFDEAGHGLIEDPSSDSLFRHLEEWADGRRLK